MAVTLARLPAGPVPPEGLDTLLATDREARALAEQLLPAPVP